MPGVTETPADHKTSYRLDRADHETVTVCVDSMILSMARLNLSIGAHQIRVSSLRKSVAIPRDTL